MIGFDPKEYRREMAQYDDYLFTYRYHHSQWDIHIRAKSPEEAQERIRALFYNGEYLGRSIAIIPVPLSESALSLTAIGKALWRRLIKGGLP